jgi:hypothetical protein
MAHDEPFKHEEERILRALLLLTCGAEDLPSDEFNVAPAELLAPAGLDAGSELEREPPSDLTLDTSNWDVLVRGGWPRA